MQTRNEKIGMAVFLLLSVWFCYVCAGRSARVFPQRFHTLLKVIFWILGVFCILFQAWTRLERAKFSILYSAAVFLSGVGVAFILCHLMMIVVTDILYFLLHFIPGAADALRRFFAVLAWTAAWVMCIYGVANAYSPQVVSYRVRPERRGGKPCRIVQLSDLHLGAVLGPHTMRKVVRIVNSLQPDLIVITGDLLNRKKTAECGDIRGAAAALAGLRAPEGVFAVTGNHDPASGDPDFQWFLRDAHIRLIDEEVVTTPYARFAGRHGNEAEYSSRLPLSVLLRRSPGRMTGPESGLQTADLPLIVLDHSPTEAGEPVRAGADLILSGHTHQGQFFPCNFVMSYYYGKTHNHGISREGHSTLIVSSGTGFFQVPFRLGTKSEICCIDLE